MNMHEIMTPGSTITVDESMSLWKGMGMPGLMVVPPQEADPDW